MRRRWSRRPVALLLTAAAAPVCGQVKVIAPRDLADNFRDSNGIVYGTTATFGAPYYGERVVGHLMYGETKGKNHCTEDDYQLPAMAAQHQAPQGGKSGETWENELVNVVLVKRGGCTFVDKVRVAEAKGAHAVIVVDKPDSDLKEKDIQKIVMADDGFGYKVHIPSILVSRFQGEKLLHTVRKEPVIVELAWDIPRGQVVIADFWMSSGSLESGEFLSRFKDSAETLTGHLQFVPHYHIFSLPKLDGSYNHLCAERIDLCDSCSPEGDKFCAPDPDGNGPVTGGDVVNEDLRQLCVWNVTARQNGRKSAMYSQEFWDYATAFNEGCPIQEGYRSDRRFGLECSRRIMKQVGIAIPQVESCVRQRYRDFLEEQVEQVAWSPLALRLNGWRYSGPLDPQTVLKAVCNGFSVVPGECQDLLTSYTGAGRMPTDGITLVGFVTSLALLGLVCNGVFFLYRRHVTSSARRVLREEVMLEVQAQMADYMPMEDDNGSRLTSSPLRTVSF